MSGPIPMHTAGQKLYDFVSGYVAQHWKEGAHAARAAKRVVPCFRETIHAQVEMSPRGENSVAYAAAAEKLCLEYLRLHPQGYDDFQRAFEAFRDEHFMDPGSAPRLRPFDSPEGLREIVLLSFLHSLLGKESTTHSESSQVEEFIQRHFHMQHLRIPGETANETRVEICLPRPHPDAVREAEREFFTQFPHRRSEFDRHAEYYFGLERASVFAERI